MLKATGLEVSYFEASLQIVPISDTHGSEKSYFHSGDHPMSLWPDAYCLAQQKTVQLFYPELPYDVRL
jgi:hypothetical protein